MQEADGRSGLLELLDIAAGVEETAVLRIECQEGRWTTPEN